MPDQAGPVATLIDALTRRDLTTVSWVMAADVVLSVPSMNVTCTTAMEATAAVSALLEAFPDLDYQVRSRYLAPGQVTDEVTLNGTQSGMLFGRRPTGRAGSVNARVLVTHDDVVVRSITLWVDHSAITALVADDEVANAARAPDISALRATIPQEPGRLIVGHRRTADSDEIGNLLTTPGESGVGSLFLSSGAEDPEHPATAEGTTPVAQQNPARSPGTGPIGQRPKARGPELKAPMPRQQRRRLAFLAGSSMLFASAAIITWVGHGAWEIAQRDAAASVRLTPGVQAPASLQAVTPSATIPSQAPSQTPEPTPSADATPTPTLPQLAAAPARIPNTNVADFKNVVGNNAFFGTSKSQLTPDAKRVLRVYCQQIRDEKRYGMVTIKAWADERGGLQYNRNLSQSRADAVRLYMLSQLADLSINKKVTFKATGEGVSTLTATAGANDRFALNRRIKIIFPRPTGAKPSVTATK